VFDAFLLHAGGAKEKLCKRKRRFLQGLRALDRALFLKKEGQKLFRRTQS
jgi:hypothetical protein